MKAPSRWLTIAILCLTAGTVAPVHSQEASLIEPGWHNDLSLPHGGLTRFYRVYVPDPLPEHAPVVVLLHGGTQSMRKIFWPQAGGAQAWIEIANREGILLVVPNGVNPNTGDTYGNYQSWNDLRLEGSEADDVGFILSLLDWVVQTYPVDSQRIYVTGGSNGGMMTYRLLIEASPRLTAGAAFIANLPDQVEMVQPERPRPLMIMNGTADPLVQWDGGTVARNRGTVISTPATVAWWVEANGAGLPMPSVMLPDLNPMDGCQIQRTDYPALPNGAPVVFYAMQGGGHAMPSRVHRIPDNDLTRRVIGPVCQDAEGAELAWDFLQQYATRADLGG